LSGERTVTPNTFRLLFSSHAPATLEFAERLAIGHQYEQNVLAYLQDQAIEAYLIAPAGSPRAAYIACAAGVFSAPDILVYRRGEPHCWIDVKMRSSWFHCRDDDKDGNWGAYFCDGSQTVEDYFAISAATGLRFILFLCMPTESRRYHLYAHILGDLAQWRRRDGKLMLDLFHFTQLKSTTCNPRLRFLRESDKSPLTDFERWLLERQWPSRGPFPWQYTREWLLGRQQINATTHGPRPSVISRNKSPTQMVRQREYQREYRRKKRAAATQEWARKEQERRAKMSPYELGVEDAVYHRAAVEHYNARPPNRCPYAEGTPEEAEYDRGWKDQMARLRTLE
jgi:hypothetical protein